jgi:hypothetical protein
MLYNYPSGAITGLIAAAVLLVVAGITLWSSRTGSSRLHHVLMAITLGVAGITMIIVSANLAATQIDFSEAANNRTYGDLPHASTAGAVIMGVVLVLLFGVIVDTIIRHKGMQLAGGVVAFFAVFTCFASNVQYIVFTDNWALAVTAGWLLTIVSLLALAVTAAVVQVRAYGVRQFDKGRMAALDLREPVRVNG